MQVDIKHDVDPEASLGLFFQIAGKATFGPSQVNGTSPPPVDALLPASPNRGSRRPRRTGFSLGLATDAAQDGVRFKTEKYTRLYL